MLVVGGEVGEVVVDGPLVDGRASWCAAFGAVAVRGNGSTGLVATGNQCSVLVDDATASFDACDFHRSGAGSSSGARSPWAEQEVLAGSPAGRTSTIGNRQKFLRAEPWT